MCVTEVGVEVSKSQVIPTYLSISLYHGLLSQHVMSLATALVPFLPTCYDNPCLAGHGLFIKNENSMNLFFYNLPWSLSLITATESESMQLLYNHPYLY